MVEKTPAACQETELALEFLTALNALPDLEWNLCFIYASAKIALSMPAPTDIEHRGDWQFSEEEMNGG